MNPDCSQAFSLCIQTFQFPVPVPAEAAGEKGSSCELSVRSHQLQSQHFYPHEWIIQGPITENGAGVTEMVAQGLITIDLNVVGILLRGITLST